MTFVNSKVDELIQGIDGQVVIESIREHYNTQYSFEKNVSNVRREFLTKNTVRHWEYSLYIKCAYEIAKDNPKLYAKVKQFAEMSLSEQYDTLHKTRKYGFASESNALSECFAKMKLLPENMNTFVLTADDLQKNIALKHETLVTRNSTAIEIVNPKDLLEAQLEILNNTTKYGSKQILALLLVCGRRETEILNGKSTFEPVPGLPYHAKFNGVLKKKSNPMNNIDNTFQIPLLCTFTLFNNALQYLRNTQKEDILSMSNKEISKRYCSQLCTATKKHLPMLTKPHDLRALYVRFVDALFEHTLAYPLLCMKSLGHETMMDTLHYMLVTFHGNIPLKKYGKF